MRIFYFLLVSVLITSVSCNIHIEKKRYSKGYHIHRYGSESVLSKNSSSNSKENHEDDDTKLKTIVNNELLLSSIKIEDPKPHKVELNFSDDNNYKSDLDSQLSEQSLSQTKKSAQKKTEDNTKISSSMLALVAGLANTLLFSLIYKKKRLKNISRWAFNNKNKARWLIGLSSVITALCGFKVGSILHGLNFHSSDYINIGTLGAVGISALIYTFFKSKLLSAKRIIYNLIFFCSFLQFTNIGLSHQEKAFQKENQTSINHTVQNLNSSDNNSDNEKKKITAIDIIGVILLTGVAIFLAIGVAYLSCFILCSGYAFLAATFFIIANLSIIVGVIYLYRLILYNKKKFSGLFWEITIYITLGLFALLYILIFTSFSEIGSVPSFEINFM